MEDNLLVGLNEYKILNEENPIAYTRDITSCIICLFHREKDAVLMHIETNNDFIEIGNFIDILENKKNKINKVDVFVGKYTTLGNLSILKFMFHRLNIEYSIYEVFRNQSNETSVGYNYNTSDYYMARMNKGKPILTRKKIN